MNSLAPARPSFTDRLTQFLAAIFRDCRGTVQIVAGRGSRQRRTGFQTSPLLSGSLPDQLLDALVEPVPDDLKMWIATSKTGRDRLDVPAVCVAIAEAPTFDPEGRFWSITTAVRTRSMQFIERFPLAPSAIVDESDRLVVFWLFDKPAPVDQPAVRERVDQLRASIAQVVNGSPADDCRIPGSHNHARGTHGQLVKILTADLDRYSLEALQAATQRTTRGTHT